jgi:hypothetical protein
MLSDIIFDVLTHQLQAEGHAKEGGRYVHQVVHFLFVEK